MKTLTKTKIEWCDMTWNPVWGCLNNCSYCYARKIANRFYKKMAEKESNYLFDKTKEIMHDEFISKEEWLELNINNFEPVFLESNFNKKLSKRPSRIFVNSMSDIMFWDDEWIKSVLNKINKYPQHKFLFLTKDIECGVYCWNNFPNNCWLGLTITNQQQLDVFCLENNSYYPDENKFFISLEPIQEKLKLYNNPDWIIVGSETGNRKGRMIPKKEWIEDIRMFCQDNNIPYFEKNSLQKIVDRDLIQEFPE